MTLGKKLLMGVGAVIGGYLAVAAVVAVALPLEIPGQELRPRTGDVLASKWEKVEQKFVGQRGDMLVGELTVLEGAGGPPLHYHSGFSEDFEVVEGTMALELEGKVVTLEAGQHYSVPPNTLHRPFSPGGKRAMVRGEIPQIFATCLSQLYGTLDQGGPGPGMMMQIAMSRAYCDTHVAPAPAEKVMFFLLTPIARLAGYKSFYPERAPKHDAAPVAAAP